MGVAFGIVGYLVGGSACSNTASGATTVNGANALSNAENIAFGLSNTLNVTNSGTANINSTFQELLSYYAGRAEAIVPYFLNFSTWNATVEDNVLIYSGLISSLEGYETSFAYQQYQDWNATANSWDAAWGPGGTWESTQDAGFLYGQVAGAAFPNSTIAINNVAIAVAPPLELWTINSLTSGGGQNNSYFNIAPGGTIMNANIYNSSLFPTGYANYTVYDLTTGTHFFMPQVTYTEYVNDNLPSVSKNESIGQFDLLRVTCNFNCYQSVHNNAVYTTFETANAYELNAANLNIKNGVGVNSAIPTLSVYNTCNDPGALYPLGCQAARFRVPNEGIPNPAICITLVPIQASGTGACATERALTGGDSVELSNSTTGGAVGGNRTLYAFASTAQSLVNNTETMAYDYWLTLRAVTENGTYAIPPNCAIPTPSDAFPTATNFDNYNLSTNNVEAVYLAYLNAVARGYGEVFTNRVGFCGDQNLGFSFNWTGSWTPLILNITASIYIAGAYGNQTIPLNLNGTPAPNVTYLNVASWPVYNIDPTLLYPFEYQANVPVGKIYPVSVNNPIVGVLVNYSGNLDYRNPAFKPAWGIPTYVSLYGNGNYTYVSGNVSNIPSGKANDSGDAIMISSCVLNGFPQTICSIAVTYFANFTIGLVHSVIPTYPYIPPNNGIGSNICGTASLNAWYDAWASNIIVIGGTVFFYIGDAAAGIPDIGGALNSFFQYLGCFVGYVLLIIVIVFIFWVIFKVAGILPRSGRSGSRASPGGNINLNINVRSAPPSRRKGRNYS